MITPTIPPENTPQDRQIDDLLHALGTQAAPPGMEQRLLRTLAERQQSLPSPSLWSRLFLHPRTQPKARLRPAALLAFSTAAVAIAILLWSSHHQHPITPPAVASQPHHAKPLTPPANTAATPRPAPRAANAAPKIPRPLPTSQLTPPTQLASFPAPPMPLTEQELLLQRIAQRRDPEQVAALDPHFQDRLDARDSADFKQFFTPPTPPTPPEIPQPTPTGDPR